MARTLVPRFLAVMELSTLDDAEVQALAGDIVLAGPTSALVLASPALQATVAAIAAKAGKLNVAVKTIDDDHVRLRLDIAAKAGVRSDLLGELRSYGTLITNVAKSPADVNCAGLPAQSPRAPRGQAPTVPLSIDNRPPAKGHGKTTVSVHETGPIRHQYAAEQSLDGLTFTPLGVGLGKTRVVTGASGTKVWVRFAMVRGQLRSDWCTPVIVTIP